MTIFLVASGEPSKTLDGFLNKNFPDNVFQVAGDQWFVSAELTTEGLYHSIYPEKSKRRFGRILIISAGNYFGWHNNDLWEWLELKKSGGADG